MSTHRADSRIRAQGLELRHAPLQTAADHAERAVLYDPTAQTGSNAVSTRLREGAREQAQYLAAHAPTLQEQEAMHAGGEGQASVPLDLVGRVAKLEARLSELERTTVGYRWGHRDEPARGMAPKPGDEVWRAAVGPGEVTE